MLLPRLYDTFKLEVESVAEKCEVYKEDQDVPSNTWVRNSLSFLLHHHMAYKCTIRKYGTLLYRLGGDLVHALTVALGQGSTTLQPIDGNATSMLTKVCKNINSKLHDQANKLIAADSVKPHNIEQLNVDAFIDDLDPTIWKAVCLITQPSNKKLTYVRKI